MATMSELDRTYIALGKIASLLKAGDEQGIADLVAQHGLAEIVSSKAIDVARGMRGIKLVLFLTEIAKANELSNSSIDYWHDLYEIVDKATDPHDGFGVLTDAILKSIKNKTDYLDSKSEFDAMDIQPRDVELALDFRKWNIVEAIFDKYNLSNSALKDWVGLLKVVLQRKPFVKDARDNLAMARLLEKLIMKAQEFGLAAKGVNSLKIYCANSLGLAEHYQDSLNMYADIPESDLGVAVVLERASCKAKLDLYGDSIKDLDLVLLSLIDLYKKGNGIPELLRNISEASYSKENAIRAFSDMATLAKVSGAELFMVSGTLLGYKRLNDFLPHDKDLDFGLIGLSKLPLLVELGLKSGLFYINPIYLKGDDTIQVPFVHVATGVWIDVFIYHDDSDNYITGVDFQFGYRQRFKFSKFEPIKIEFFGVETYIPSNSDLNLLENFSNWRDSDPFYISHLESPSVIDFGGKAYQLTLRLSAMKALQNQDNNKISRILKIFRNSQDFEYGAKDELIEKYESLASWGD